MHNCKHKAWLVFKAVDIGSAHHYRYLVEGVNLNYPPGHMNREFRWRVPSLDQVQYAVMCEIEVRS